MHVCAGVCMLCVCYVHQPLLLQLRRAEHHLHDAEKPAVLLNGANKPASHDYSVVVDRIPSYRITNSGSGTGVSAHSGGHCIINNLIYVIFFQMQSHPDIRYLKSKIIVKTIELVSEIFNYADKADDDDSYLGVW